MPGGGQRDRMRERRGEGASAPSDAERMQAMKDGTARVTPEFIAETARRAGLDISGYDMDQLTEGYRVELEHFTARDKPEINVVSSLADPLKIAMAHLDELRDYYTRLEEMEGE